jgi:hypothetical protein
LDSRLFGRIHFERTKATLIYRRTRNSRAFQLLLGHTKIESTVRYLGIEVDDALAIAEQLMSEYRAERTCSARLTAGLCQNPKWRTQATQKKKPPGGGSLLDYAAIHVGVDFHRLMRP